MTTILVPVGSVHEAATVCDHLSGRPAVDRVVGVGVAPPADPTAARDVGDALNVLGVRLPEVEVETEQRQGDPAEEALVVAAAFDVDEVAVAEGYDGVDAIHAASELPIETVDGPAE